MTATFIPDAVEAMIALGRHADAEPLIEALERNGNRLSRHWMIAVGARCRSMLLAARGDVTGAACLIRDALAEHQKVPMPFERARTQLLFGQLERRQRKKEAATAALREALQSFEDMGAPLWADRARTELARFKAAPSRETSLTQPSGGSPNWRPPVSGTVTSRPHFSSARRRSKRTWPASTASSASPRARNSAAPSAADSRCACDVGHMVAFRQIHRETPDSLGGIRN